MRPCSSTCCASCCRSAAYARAPKRCWKKSSTPASSSRNCKTSTTPSSIRRCSRTCRRPRSRPSRDARSRRRLRRHHLAVGSKPGHAHAVIRHATGNCMSNLIIKLGPQWARFSKPVTGMSLLGSVQQDAGIGALARSPDGTYWQINGDQRRKLKASQVACRPLSHQWHPSLHLSAA